MKVFEGLVAEGLVAGSLVVEEESTEAEDDRAEEKGNKKRAGRNRKMLPEDEHKLFLKMRHIHRQLGHPCKRVWTKMMKDAGL